MDTSYFVRTIEWNLWFFILTGYEMLVLGVYMCNKIDINRYVLHHLATTTAVPCSINCVFTVKEEI